MPYVIATVLAVVLIAATWYAVRFVAEYRKIKREINRIVSSGHAKSTIRRMRREAMNAKRRKT